MTDKDWADEIAINLMSGHDSGGVLNLTWEELAAALRRAKADGMREAAVYFENLSSENHDEAERRWAAAEFIRAAASKLQSSTD